MLRWGGWLNFMVKNQTLGKYKTSIGSRNDSLRSKQATLAVGYHMKVKGYRESISFLWLGIKKVQT